MARQVMTYYAAANSSALTMTAALGITKTVSFTDLAATSDEGITIPTFDTAPKVKIIGKDCRSPLKVR